MPEGSVSWAGIELVHSAWHQPAVIMRCLSLVSRFLPGTSRYVSRGVGRVSRPAQRHLWVRKGGAQLPLVAWHFPTACAFMPSL